MDWDPKDWERRRKSLELSDERSRLTPGRHDFSVATAPRL